MNVFRKCLWKQFGKHRYDVYVRMCEEELVRQCDTVRPEDGELHFDENNRIYRDMYKRLCYLDAGEIRERTEDMAGAVMRAFCIGRGFAPALAFYVVVSLVLIGLKLEPVISLTAMALISLCFAYKIREYISNRFCFLDAYLAMIYKAVLEALAKSN